MKLKIKNLSLFKRSKLDHRYQTNQIKWINSKKKIPTKLVNLPDKISPFCSAAVKTEVPGVALKITFPRHVFKLLKLISINAYNYYKFKCL